MNDDINLVISDEDKEPSLRMIAEFIEQQLSSLSVISRPTREDRIKNVVYLQAWKMLLDYGYYEWLSVPKNMKRDDITKLDVFNYIHFRTEELKRQVSSIRDLTGKSEQFWDLNRKRHIEMTVLELVRGIQDEEERRLEDFIKGYERRDDG